MANTYQQLSAEERGVVMAMKVQCCSARSIAAVLGRSPSTITRELRRNGYQSEAEQCVMGRPRLAGGYDAARAGKRARRVRRAAWPTRKLHCDGVLWPQVRSLLELKLSPEQIAAKLRQRHPGQPQLQASHETIYTAIYAMPKGDLRRELVVLLRQGRGARKPRTRGDDRRGSLQDILSIHVRPPEANDRLLPGHWEGDLIKGKANASAVGTLVCRRSLFAMLVKLDGSTALDALNGFTLAFSALPPEIRQTLTYDQGKEMALHEKLAENTGLKIYFCDPHSPWQRGINEHTNGLLRQYLPKGTDLSVYSQRELDAMAWELNMRPRKTLGWRSPAEVFFDNVYMDKAGLVPTVALGL
ncbi:IS30 family transposase [Xylophilus sp. GOD-11R]|uniref:IS30 family transposase n=1 Tax=Xylophilus sp. GOD-11R TaxID=3089814 RepID=UPI00298C13DB|nr:IS30 family transposase [Xylophilus sp. GOD-11R]WPB58854.1 IS30 family transposase [Xylophilus sp. GOD-11R]